MDPVLTPMVIGAAVAGGSQIVGAIGQWIAAKQAKGERDETLARMEEIFSKIKTPQYDENGTPLPKYDISTITPEDFKVIQKATPTIAARIQEVAPTVVKETGDMRTGRSAQMDALSRLRKVGAGEADPEYLNKLAQSSRNASINAQSRSDSILQDQARRGLLGSGNQLAAQLQGSTAAMDRQSQEGMSAAAESYRNQLQALRDSATLGGQVRSADMDFQGRNADIINAYNSRSAFANQQSENNRASALTNADLYNTGVAQRVGDANVAQRNEAARYYQNLGNWAEGQRFNDAEGARASYNNLQTNKFHNDTTIAQGRLGQLGNRMAANQQDALDTRNTISGIAGGIGSAGMAYGQHGQNQQDRADKKESEKAWLDALKLTRQNSAGGQSNVFEG